MDFLSRHLGPRPADITAMLEVVGVQSLDELIDQAVPASIRSERPLDLPPAMAEDEALEALRERADANEVWRSWLGMGYHDTITPPVILRNILENPSWYTAYTPYQAEISQGRLEALLIYQTVIEDLCGLDIANASLLDEATAAAEAMTMCHRILRGKRNVFLVSDRCHPQTLAVVQTRAAPLGIEVVVGDPSSFESFDTAFGLLLQYPDTEGVVASDLKELCERAHAAKCMVTMATDLLALTVLESPGALGADIAIGNSQRFGVPLGYGGPHAAFMATHHDHRRQMPGRIIGVSKDVHGDPALRMALQTREQHIRRQKATSNICTAQVLLAVVAGMYAVWHGPEGLKAIAERVHDHARRLATSLEAAGFDVGDHLFFDTVRVAVDEGQRDRILAAAAEHRINLRTVDGALVIAFDERVRASDVDDLLACFGAASAEPAGDLLRPARRTSSYLTHPVFSAHRSETSMLRFLHKLASKDLALDTAMIPLGSCTMKLNATTEMIPVTWRQFGGLHPFAPVAQAQGYRRLFDELEAWLCEITGFDAVSLQPNAGSQGEYAGLLAIRGYHLANGDDHRHICLIPTSAHGTNPASAVMAGMKVVAVACDDNGNIDVEDLKAKADKHSDKLAALMVTYPSTHGVFEEPIREICEVVHGHGGQVYMDGANMNAMVGLARPGEIGADVLHLNLHKTFCIPHGGGGPGMGPIGVRAHLAPHLPGHPVEGELAVSAAPWGSSSILPISWAYIAMCGGPGLTRASQVAILAANYVAKRLEGHYPVLYTGANGFVAHECILDTRQLKSAGIQVDDIAKRLIDYGFHAPTMSFPVAGTLMVEPTESEDRYELDRFVEAMVRIRDEVREVEDGRADPEDNVLRNAPHTAMQIGRDDWPHPYSRQVAAWPTEATRDHKYWAAVGRIDNAWGDRHLICSCQVDWTALED